jgi:hypothetical protein
MRFRATAHLDARGWMGHNVAMRHMCLLAVCGLVLLGSGCRPRFLSVLDNADTAQDVWQDIRQAHTGGRALRTVRFHAEETFSPGIAELFYPELAPGWVGLNRLDFSRRNAWQAVAHNGQRFTWMLQNGDLLTLRNGTPYNPRLGINRGVHLKAMLRLMRPWDAWLKHEVDVTLLPSSAEGHPRLRFQEREGPRDTFILEADRDTGLVRAVEFTVKEIGLTVPHRDEYSDHRNVGGGIMMAHTIRETLLLPSGAVGFHDIQLWGVEVEMESPFPGGEMPRGWEPPLVEGPRGPTPLPAAPPGANR